MTWSSICAVSTRRRNRLRADGGSASIMWRTLLRNLRRTAALSSVAAAASGRCWQAADCANGDLPSWRSWLWVECRTRRTVMAHTTDRTVLKHIEELVAEEKALYAK